MKNIFSPDTNFSDGYVINIDKPLGWTSTDVVRKIKFQLQRCGYRKIKVGHAGTLDPLASGVLLVCVGKATKRVDELQAERKEYLTDILFGGSTPSYDLEHPVDKTYPWEHITKQMLQEAVNRLMGDILQTPPVYSAKKIDGIRAYEYAREGTDVELKKAAVTIYSIDIEEIDMPRVRLRINCSKGTYIRSIARDLGEMLESGAHLIMLRRERSGDYFAKDAHSVDDVTESLINLRKILEK